MSAYWRNFDLTNGVNILRLICGLFFIPHIVGKFTEPATLNFFKAAKFNPPATWMYVAGSDRDRADHRAGVRHLHAVCRRHRRLASAGGRSRDLQGDQEVDLGDRRRRILRVLDAELRRARHADVAEIRSNKINVEANEAERQREE